MIRGRRVVFFVACISFLFLPFKSILASDMAVTATVTLSPLWQEAIENRSIITLDSKAYRNISKLQMTVRGFEGVKLPPQRIQAILLADDMLADTQEIMTDSNSEASFTFVHKRGVPYRLFIINTGNGRPFVMRILSFTP